MGKIGIDKIKILIDPSLFWVGTLIMLFMKSNPYINSTIFADIAMVISVLWGGSIMIDLLRKNGKSIIKNTYVILLIIFILSYFITVVLNLQYQYMSNFKDIIWFVIQLTTMFILQQYLDPQKREQGIKYVVNTYILISFCFALGSLFFVFLNIGGVTDYGKWGFLSQRLFGIYRSPNYGALYCVISIILSIACLHFTRMKIQVCLWINILVNYLYVIYSVSNTGLVSLIIMLLVYGLLKIFIMHFNIKKIIIYFLFSIFVIGMITPIREFTTKIIGVAENQQTTNVLEGKITDEHNNQMDVNDFPEDTSTIPEETKNKLQNSDSVTFERTYMPDEMIGNGRITHWMMGLNVFNNHKWFGTSIRGYLDTVESEFPDAEEIQKSETLENDFLTLLVCTGISGCCIFMLFTLKVFIDLLKTTIKMRKNVDKKETQKYIITITIIVVIAVTMCFTDAIIYTNVIQSFVFWIALGYALNGKYTSKLSV